LLSDQLLLVQFPDLDVTMDEGRTSSFEVTVQGAPAEAKGEGVTLLWSKLAKGRSDRWPSQPAASNSPPTQLLFDVTSHVAVCRFCRSVRVAFSFPDSKTIIALYRQAAGLASA